MAAGAGCAAVPVVREQLLFDHIHTPQRSPWPDLVTLAIIERWGVHVFSSVVAHQTHNKLP